MRVHHAAHRGAPWCTLGPVCGRDGAGGAAGPGRGRVLARQPGQVVRRRHPRRDPGRSARDGRGDADGTGQPGARRGPCRAGPAGCGERADPDRPRLARPARPLADHDHGEGGAGAPARAGRSRGGGGPDHRGRGTLPAGAGRRPGRGVRLPRGHPGQRARPRPGAAAGLRDHRRPAHGHRRCRPSPPGAVWLGRAGGPDQRDPPRTGAFMPGTGIRLLRRDHRRRSGSAAAPGNGLRGLRERAAAAGGGVDAGPVQPAGWRLRVWVPAADAPPAVGGTAPAARDTASAAGTSLLPAPQGR